LKKSFVIEAVDRARGADKAAQDVGAAAAMLLAQGRAAIASARNAVNASSILLVNAVWI